MTKGQRAEREKVVWSHANNLAAAITFEHFVHLFHAAAFVLLAGSDHLTLMRFYFWISRS